MTKMCELTGQKVVVGRNVSHTKGHPTRTSKKFVPNLKKATFKSVALGKDITLQVATGTLRTINKYGGFDAFIINCRKNKLTPDAKIFKKKAEKSLEKSGLITDIKVVKAKKVRRINARKRDGKIKK
ncbi:MAG: 50S ribosomal protein L28 [Rickettsiales bacterium]|jgi:large subunit ribosomal protein L28|nr:50S ribosomal protein L28 [Rickettsiales bacterium]